jgi:hypothetical protein
MAEATMAAAATTSMTVDITRDTAEVTAEDTTEATAKVTAAAVMVGVDMDMVRLLFCFPLSTIYSNSYLQPQHPDTEARDLEAPVVSFSVESIQPRLFPRPPVESLFPFWSLLTLRRMAWPVSAHGRPACLAGGVGGFLRRDGVHAGR